MLLSDTHIPHKYVDLLKQWHNEKNQGFNYDYVFVSGDIVCLPNGADPPKSDGDGVRCLSVEQETEAEAMIQTFLMNTVEGFADELLYVPGNHDPSTMFSKDRN